MNTQTINRPWQKKHKQGTRYNPDPYYQSKAWKNLREEHRNGTTVMPDGYILSNIFCIDCYKEEKRLVEGKHCDHIVQRKEGGKDELTNLQTQCDHHHASKSAREKNKMYAK